MKYWLLSGLSMLISCSSPLPVPVIDADKECIQNARTCHNYADGLDSFKKVVGAYKAFAIKWEHVADTKKLESQTADEITFYGLLASAVGLATKSPETVIAGASVGAAGTLYSKRYRLEVQSHNYDLASQAMQCLYMATFPFKDRKFPDNHAIRNAALDSLTNVRGKLRQLQYSMVLGTPDISGLIAIINNPYKMPTPVITGNNANTVSDMSQAETNELFNEMKKCETKLN
ncbi:MULTISPECIES: hypothetical protein [Klebsiella]|uniref:hypothetical protein n=1 Tax=Klebsiella TaxID=570 RepID=UPI001BCB1559|nr:MULTISPECIES: hypothetical protein [Klebsiella]MDA3990883.1 hypothetical protein [Klebsiella aerogenes]MDQ8582907.1 hypothetical protein [Klebsiella aerogenes]MDU9365233.1 hypothetical protein [Klebsiella sp. 141203]HBR7307648.1 hypothetical protein [Klebsiella aerogenes]HCT4439040.1 hypothetical protein [Klebsiella aerogenes]